MISSSTNSNQQDWNIFFQKFSQLPNENEHQKRAQISISPSKFLINKHIQLRNDFNKVYDNEMARIVQESDLEFKDKTPTLEQLIENQNNTKIEYQNLKEKFERLTNQRTVLKDEFNQLSAQIEVFRKQRDHFQQLIDRENQVIKNKSSKICFRKHNDALITMVFNNDGCLENFLMENKENSTKEDYWNYLYEKHL